MKYIFDITNLYQILSNDIVSIFHGFLNYNIKYINSNMACDRSSEKDNSVAFEKLSFTSSDLPLSQTKKDSENAPPLPD